MYRFAADLRESFYPWVSSCLAASAVSSWAVVYILQRFFRFLYGYQLWMFMDRGQLKEPGLVFKLWVVCVRMLNKINAIGWQTNNGKPMLYSYQRTLPNLPLPPIQQTIDK